MCQTTKSVLVFIIVCLSCEIFCSKETCGNSNDVDCDHEAIIEIEDVGLIDESLNKYEQDDPELVRIIRERYLIPPSTEPYNFSVKAGLKLEGQSGQPLIIDEMLNGKFKRGFFLEAGAHDGETISNTLHFELKHQWTGLLVEPNPDPFQKLLKKHRRAWSLGNCFSTKTTPEIVEFDASEECGGIINKDNAVKPGDINNCAAAIKYLRGELNRRTLRVQCFPVYSVLLALGNPTVHLFSLDIEGAELQVLRTIPWDKVDFKILNIEMLLVGHIFEGKAKEVVKLLDKAGFDFYRDVGYDKIFVKRGFSYEKTMVLL